MSRRDQRRPDPDAFRNAVMARLDHVEPESPAPRLDRDARRTLGAVIGVVAVVGAAALMSRWSDGRASEDVPATAATSIEGAFQRLSVDPSGEDVQDGNSGESATEGPGGRYQGVVATAPGRST